MRRFREFYGSSPLHLLAMLASLALAGYVAQFLLVSRTIRVLIWFVGSAVLHDLLLVPLYALADQGLSEIYKRTSGDRQTEPWLNYVRFPAAISLLLLLVFWPEVTRRRTALNTNSNLSTHPYFTHWLLVTAVLFVLSAITYAVRLRKRSRSAT